MTNLPEGVIPQSMNPQPEVRQPQLTNKDYLMEEGFEDVVSPGKPIKKAFETGLIKDGHGWMQMLESRECTNARTQGS